MITYYSIPDEKGRPKFYRCETAGLADLAPCEEFELLSDTEEIREVATYFGFTVEKFSDQPPKIQAAMIRDFRIQTGSEPPVRPVPSQGETLGSVLSMTVVLGVVVAIIIYFFTRYPI